MTWRPADAQRRPKPTFQPIVRDVALTNDEKAALANHPSLMDYPHADFLSAPERAMCHYFRWFWRNGDER